MAEPSLLILLFCQNDLEKKDWSGCGFWFYVFKKAKLFII
jgi:hypothetical protein